jgi:CheY-like chemotaxis protein
MAQGLPRLDGLHVFVIEDDDDSRSLLAQTLEYLGALVSATTAADLALDDLKEFRPSAIVCDLAMPRMDGVAFIRTLRAHADAQTRDIPVIAVTAYYERYTRDEMLGIGATEYFKKPIALEALCAAIDRHRPQRDLSA